MTENFYNFDRRRNKTLFLGPDLIANRHVFMAQNFFSSFHPVILKWTAVYNIVLTNYQPKKSKITQTYKKIFTRKVNILAKHKFKKRIKLGKNQTSLQTFTKILTKNLNKCSKIHTIDQKG